MSTKALRERRPLGSARRREDDQQATVVVVGGKDVGDRFGRQIALGVYRDLLAERAHPPLERGLDRVGDSATVAVGALAALPCLPPLQAEDLLHRTADHVLVGEAGTR